MRCPQKPKEPTKPLHTKSYKKVMEMYGRNPDLSLNELKILIKSRKRVLQLFLDNEEYANLRKEASAIETLQYQCSKLQAYEEAQAAWPAIWKQYEINLKVYHAWEIKKEEDKLRTKLHGLEGKRETLERQLKKLEARKQKMIDESEG